MRVTETLSIVVYEKLHVPKMEQWDRMGSMFLKTIYNL